MLLTPPPPSFTTANSTPVLEIGVSKMRVSKKSCHGSKPNKAFRQFTSFIVAAKTGRKANTAKRKSISHYFTLYKLIGSKGPKSLP
jgi:hypothetical protein